MVQFAHRQELAHREPLRVQRSECEGSLAETAEMLAQLRGVECSLARGSERDLAGDRHLILSGAEDGFERTSGSSEDAHVERGLALSRRTLKAREALTGAREQRGLRRAQHAPAHRNALARGDGLAQEPVVF